MVPLCVPAPGEQEPVVDPDVEDDQGQEGQDPQQQRLRHIHVQADVERIIPDTEKKTFNLDFFCHVLIYIFTLFCHGCRVLALTVSIQRAVNVSFDGQPTLSLLCAAFILYKQQYNITEISFPSTLSCLVANNKTTALHTVHCTQYNMHGWFFFQMAHKGAK